jgi:hypothetical protein
MVLVCIGMSVAIVVEQIPKVARIQRHVTMIRQQIATMTHVCIGTIVVTVEEQRHQAVQTITLATMMLKPIATTVLVYMTVARATTRFPVIMIPILFASTTVPVSFGMIVEIVVVAM